MKKKFQGNRSIKLKSRSFLSSYSHRLVAKSLKILEKPKSSCNTSEYICIGQFFFYSTNIAAHFDLPK